MTQFNIGDIVQLKSGGPVMTVQTLGLKDSWGKDGALECVYFDGATRREEVFLPGVLSKL